MNPKVFLRAVAIIVLNSLVLWSSDFEVITIAGTGTKGYSGDGGKAVDASINNPYGVVQSKSGDIYFCDMDNHSIRRIDSKGVISTVAGTGKRGNPTEGSQAASADLNEPYEIREGRDGSLFFVEMRGSAVRRIQADSKTIHTVAGGNEPGFFGDGSDAKLARFKQPHSIQFDRAGNLYVCDIGNHRIRVIDSAGKITTAAGTGVARLPQADEPIPQAGLKGPRAMDFDSSGEMWLALREGNSIYRSVGGMKNGRWELVGGNGESGFSGNGGPALSARLSGPKGISVGPDGDVYFADTESHTIRVIRTKSGKIECVLGDGVRGNGTSRNPLECRLARPHGIFAAEDGSLIVADSENHKLRLLRRLKSSRLEK